MSAEKPKKLGIEVRKTNKIILVGKKGKFVRVHDWQSALYVNVGRVEVARVACFLTDLKKGRGSILECMFFLHLILLQVKYLDNCN